MIRSQNVEAIDGVLRQFRTGKFRNRGQKVWSQIETTASERDEKRSASLRRDLQRFLRSAFVYVTGALATSVCGLDRVSRALTEMSREPLDNADVAAHSF